LYRYVQGSNLLLDNQGNLKIADFGLAIHRLATDREPLTNRVITLWYRPPELLLGSTHYDNKVDIWSAGCILAELLHGSPILPGQTEVEQLHKIFKLCGSDGAADLVEQTKGFAIAAPPRPYPRRVLELFEKFPKEGLALVDRLLSLDPKSRGSARSAMDSAFFRVDPSPEPLSLVGPLYKLNPVDSEL
jgi:serine/threonine protein kinase